MNLKEYLDYKIEMPNFPIKYEFIGRKEIISTDDIIIGVVKKLKEGGIDQAKQYLRHLVYRLAGAHGACKRWLPYYQAQDNPPTNINHFNKYFQKVRELLNKTRELLHNFDNLIREYVEHSIKTIINEEAKQFDTYESTLKEIITLGKSNVLNRLSPSTHFIKIGEEYILIEHKDKLIVIYTRKNNEIKGYEIFKQIEFDENEKANSIIKKIGSYTKNKNKFLLLYTLKGLLNEQGEPRNSYIKIGPNEYLTMYVDGNKESRNIRNIKLLTPEGTTEIM